MLTIPNLLEPLEDEMFYSYISRLAKENGCQDIKYFAEKYISQKSNIKKNYTHYSYDGKELFPQFLNLYNNYDHNFIKNCSLYPFHAIFLTAYRQALFVDSFFNTLHVKKSKKYVNLISELHYCKECMKEDVRNYGHFYLHRSHQTPGVTVCHKHHTPLFRFNDNTPLESTTDAIDFAEFSSALLCANLQTDIAKLQEITQTHCKNDDINDSFNRNKIPNIIRILMDTFGSVKTLDSYLLQDNNTTLKFISAVNNEYDVFEPYKTTIIKMRHKSCGTEFYTTPAGFLAGWKCPSCFRRTDIPTASFKDAVSALVGNEYTILSDYKGQHQSIEIRHNTCGHTHNYQPNSFLRGQRCPHCNTTIPNDAVPNMVNYITNGQYKVTHKHGKNLYEITESGGQIIELSKEHFLQELRRPTPSNVLPVPVKQLRDNWNEEMWKPKPASISPEDFIEKIHSVYNDTDLIFKEDLINLFPKNLHQVLNNGTFKLLIKKEFYSIEKGIYTLTPQTVQPERLIKEKYLIRQGHRIGFFESKSLAYELGLTKDKPNIIYIMTNKESDQSHRRLTINGYKLRLQGNKLTITDDNYQYLMVLEALKYCWHYGLKNTNKISIFIKKNNLKLNRFLPLLPVYSDNIQKLFKKIWEKAS